MEQKELTRESNLELAGAFWQPRWRDDGLIMNSRGDAHLGEESRIALAPREDINERDPRRAAWQNALSLIRPGAFAQNSQMTFASFVEVKFLPEHIAFKRPSGQAHYQAMLKHVIAPEEVDRMFCVKPQDQRRKLKTIQDWPYLTNVRLCDVRPDHVWQLTSTALACGYSMQTVIHIRNVVSAIFSHAKDEYCFIGNNPASAVRLRNLGLKKAYSLTLNQVSEALGIMQYPAKEMMLVALLTGMNPAEIFGLQWKQVNLTNAEISTDGTPVPAMAISVRSQWHRGELEDVKENRFRILPISQPLLQILLKLRGRARFTAPGDFVLVSQAGTPINQNNVGERGLKPIAKKLGVPSLSWQVFRRTRQALASEFGTRFQNLLAAMIPPESGLEISASERWRCRVQRERFHTL